MFNHTNLLKLYLDLTGRTIESSIRSNYTDCVAECKILLIDVVSTTFLLFQSIITIRTADCSDKVISLRDCLIKLREKSLY